MLKIIENELFDLSLQLQSADTDKVNLDYILGYRSALNVILERAYGIYNRGITGEMVFLDERTESATELLLLSLKKRR